MRNSFASTMLAVGRRDTSLVVLVGDISHGILKPFAQEFPTRYFNVGICEPTIANMASGLSKVGLTPVIHTIAPFLIERSFEQIKLDFEYEQQSVNMISVGSGFDYSQLGCTHHCYDDIALMRQLPSSLIFVPGTPAEFCQMFEENYRRDGIKYFRLSEQTNEVPHLLGGGTARVQEGSDVTVVALGTRLDAAMDAVKNLKSTFSSDVFLVNRVKPLDQNPIRDSVSRTRRLLVVEEHSVIGGLADACLQHLAGMPFQFKSLGVRDFVHTYGTHEDLCKTAGVSSQDIYDALSVMLETGHGEMDAWHG